MTNYPEHQWQIAAFLLFWSVCFYSYTRLRPEARRQVIRTGAKITFLGAVVFAMRWVLLSPDQPNRVQLLAYYAGVFPYTWAIGYISQVCAANQAKKWPALEAACRKAKPVFLLLVIFTLLFCIVFPAPAISTAEGFVSPYPWLDAAYNLTHLFFLGISALVFGREAFREQYVTSTFMRVQHTALLVGSVVFSLLSLNYLIATWAAATNLPSALELVARQLFLPVELIALILGGLAYMIGLFLYDSNDDLHRIHSQTDLWIEYRATLEHELFTRFGPLIGDRDTDIYFRLISDPDYEKERFPFKLPLSDQERSNAAYMLKLLGLIAQGDTKATYLITTLKNLHRRLAKETATIPALVFRMDATTTYDLTRDSLYEATAPALEFASKTAKIDPRQYPDWAQLAALLAARAGFLPIQTARYLLAPKSHPTSSTVRAAYTNATDRELLNYLFGS